MNTISKADQNRAKQIKNAKRGGYTPTIAKDVHKHIKQKLVKVEKHLDEIFDQKWDEWKTTADMHSQGFADGIEYAQQQIRELLK